MLQKYLTLKANNVLYYYRDLAAAKHFYHELLGFDLVEDYGFAALFQVASSSFMMLIDASIGRHSADEPKTVTTAFVTDEPEAWYHYLTAQGVQMVHEFNTQAGQAHDGFVIVDPEGYYLEFERFNTHPQNARLLPVLDKLASHYPVAEQATLRPSTLGVKATITWLYYQDLARAQRFFEDTLGLTLVVDQGFAQIYPTSHSGFLGPVRAGEGLHAYTAEKGVTVSFFTEQIDEWFAYLQTRPEFALQNDAVQLELDSVRDFLGFDPEGYFIEFDLFLPHPKNATLRKRLQMLPEMPLKQIEA